jgi:lantibiotic biosynthesis protein
MAILKTMDKCELIVNELAIKMRDPENVRHITLKRKNINPVIGYSPWADLSLSHGYPAIVLFYAHLDALHPAEGWDYVTHNYIVQIVRCLEKEGIQDASLYSGLTGICYAIWTATRKKTRYQSLLHSLNQQLITTVRDRLLVPLQIEVQRGIPSPAECYDVIQGIVGVGVYCLMNREEPMLLELLLEIIAVLIKRCQPITVGGREVEGWYLPVEFQFSDKDKQLYPLGNYNLGMAHGIPGILSFFSLCLLKEIEIPEQREMVKYLVKWIKNQSKSVDGEIIFPDRVAIKPDQTHFDYLHRDGWCYGTPGVTRSLYQASRGLKNQPLKNYALKVFKGIFNRTEEQWWLPGPTFCHGIAGLLAITNRMQLDTNDSWLLEKRDQLLGRLLSFYDSSFPFGFQDLEPSQFKKGNKDVSYRHINKPGLLDGTTGAALTLMNLGFKESSWDASFLI